MIEAEPLIRTALDRPDDDAPRLVFADWLEEQGEPQAELIRVQCALAALPADDRGRPALEQRERELRAAFDPLWFGPLHDLGVFNGRFHRGFLQVHVNGIRQLLALADRLFALPWVLHVSLGDGSADRAAVADLVESPHFGRLRQLDLSRCRLANDGVQLLARSRTPCRLTHLDLSSNLISSNALQFLVEYMDLSHLTELRLSGNGIGDAGAKALGQTARLGRLRVLDLSYNQLRSVGGEYLAEAVSLNQLRSLNVRGNSIGGTGKRALKRRFGPRVHLGTAGSPF